MKYKVTNYILGQRKFKLNKRQIVTTASTLKLFWFCFWQKIRIQRGSWKDSGREQGSIVLHVRVARTSRHPFLSSASLANKLWQIMSCWNFQFILYVPNSFNLQVPLYSLFSNNRASGDSKSKFWTASLLCFKWCHESPMIWFFSFKFLFKVQ